MTLAYPARPPVYLPWPPPSAGWWYVVSEGPGCLAFCGVLPYPEPPAAPPLRPPPAIVAQARRILDAARLP